MNYFLHLGYFGGWPMEMNECQLVCTKWNEQSAMSLCSINFERRNLIGIHNFCFAISVQLINTSEILNAKNEGKNDKNKN